LNPSTLYAQSAGGVDCDSGHYPAGATVNKSTRKTEVNMEPLQLQKLETTEAREQVNISYRFAVSDNVIDKEDNNRAGSNIGENIKI
jgi:hypothetical protein